MTAKQVLEGIEKVMGVCPSRGEWLEWWASFDLKRRMVHTHVAVVHDGIPPDQEWHRSLKDALEDALRREGA